jgi:hypothetical protein
MFNNSFFRKVSMVSAIVAIAIVAGMMAGCQKEMEDEMMVPVKEITKDEFYKTIRLKSGGENPCDNNKVTKAQFTLSQYASNQISLPITEGQVFEIEYHATHYASSGGTVKTWNGYNWDSQNYLSYDNGIGNHDSRYFMGQASGNMQIHAQHNWGSPVQVTIYYCYY